MPTNQLQANNILNNLQAYVQGIVNKHSIPALSLAVWYKGQLHQAAAGVLNVETGVEATTDSAFQIGSISKVFTASLIMQLVDTGRIALDTPVKHYLRDFHVADSEATAKVTVRQLLNHTHGLCDFYPEDPSTGGNPIARFVDRCYLLPQVHPPGSHFSYCNSGYAIAGRLIEVVMGISWFDVMEEHIIKPLGLSHTFANPLHAHRFRTAIGHISDPKSADTQSWRLAPNGYLPLGIAPAGASLTLSAADLITFARAHLSQGLTSSLPKGTLYGGRRWLSAKAVQQMQTSNVTLPPYALAFGTDMGLGWFLQNNNGTRTIGHNGGTYGQLAMLRLIPEQDLAFASLINGEDCRVNPLLYADLMAAFAGVHVEQPETSDVATSLEKLTGKFESLGTLAELSLEEGELVLRMSVTVSKQVMIGPLRLHRIIKSKYSFVGYSESRDTVIGTIVFLDPDENGAPQYLSNGARLLRRVQK